MHITVNKNLNFKGKAICAKEMSSNFEKKLDAKEIPFLKIEFSSDDDIFIAGEEDVKRVNKCLKIYGEQIESAKGFRANSGIDTSHIYESTTAPEFLAEELGLVN